MLYKLVLRLCASTCSSDGLWLPNCSARISHTHPDSKGTLMCRDGDGEIIVPQPLKK